MVEQSCRYGRYGAAGYCLVARRLLSPSRGVNTACWRRANNKRAERLCKAALPIFIENWRKHYNTKRSHSALGYRLLAPEAIVSMEEKTTHALTFKLGHIGCSGDAHVMHKLCKCWARGINGQGAD